MNRLDEISDGAGDGAGDISLSGFLRQPDLRAFAVAYDELRSMREDCNREHREEERIGVRAAMRSAPVHGSRSADVLAQGGARERYKDVLEQPLLGKHSSSELVQRVRDDRRVAMGEDAAAEIAEVTAEFASVPARAAQVDVAIAA